MIGETRAMKLAIEILAAVLLLVCVSASSAAFAAALRGDQAAMRRQVFRELLRRQAAVGELSCDAQAA
jgi:hypothetical protein